MSDNLLFDPALTERVTDAVNALGVPAVVDHYEPGMAQVRLDPTDGAPSGYVAVAGTTDDGREQWVLVETDRIESGFYNTNGKVTDLRLDHDAPVDAVARAIVDAVRG